MIFIGAGLVILLFGCAGGGGVKKGQRFKVVSEIRVNTSTEWDGPYSDGFISIIPVGTVVEARYSVSASSAYFEAVPVMVNGRGDERAVTRYFVPEAIRTREGFLGFSFSLPLKAVGTQLNPL